MNPGELLLFPLHTVLFPGGDLRLRVFEPRYLELVRHCSSRGETFGVVSILEGEEVGKPALPAAFGTHARIVDFYSLDDGTLGITVQGESCFHVRRTRVRDNGLILSEVEPAPAAQSTPLQPLHALLAMLLERMFERIGTRHANADRRLFDDAGWVGYRLAELLPFSVEEKQALLECRDVDLRLDRILNRLPDWQAD